MKRASFNSLQKEIQADLLYEMRRRLLDVALMAVCNGVTGNEVRLLLNKALTKANGVISEEEALQIRLQKNKENADPPTEDTE